MSDSIIATAGFFWNDAVSPTTATDLLTAVEEANANLDGAIAAEDSATASATAAASSALSAMGSQTAAATSETNAATSASTAATSATAAASSATAAASSASSAAADVTAAASSASGAATSATAAAGSATAAGNSATNAATSATAAAASATTASNAAATIPAPSSGRKLNFIRVNSSGNAYEVQTAAQAAADLGTLNDAGRNKLHNGLFSIWQRGAGAFTATGYTADRWKAFISTDTASITRQLLSDADRSAIADEEAGFSLQNVFAGDSGAGSFNAVSQLIENVRRLANRTVTLSFYAKASSGTPKIGASLDQVFGTGGSPSASVQGSGTAVTISSSWGYYTLPIVLSSISGKTLGTNGDSYTQLNFWFSSGSTNATRAASIGVQSNTIQIWGAQLEIGTVVTPLEKPDPQQALATCQRFYEIGEFQLSGYAATGIGLLTTGLFAVPKRATPTTTTSGTSSSNVSPAAFSASSARTYSVSMTIASTGGGTFGGSFQASADL